MEEITQGGLGRSEQLAYEDLCFYTLAHGDPSFIHQHVVDAFAAQNSTAHDKPIKLTFALIGLYLHVEKEVSGKQIQRIHMKLARRKRAWPAFALPLDRGTVTAVDVIAAPEGSGRDRMIDEWCVSVWEAFRGNRQTVIDLLNEYGIS